MLQKDNDIILSLHILDNVSYMNNIIIPTMYIYIYIYIYKCLIIQISQLEIGMVGVNRFGGQALLTSSSDLMYKNNDDK